MNIPMIETVWKQFEQRILPEDAGPVQRRAMRTAFYGGAHSMFLAVMEISERPEDRGEALLQALHEELVAFAHSMGVDNDKAKH